MSAHFTNLCSEDFWVFLDIDRDIFSQRISKIEVNKKCWWFDIVLKIGIWKTVPTNLGLEYEQSLLFGEVRHASQKKNQKKTKKSVKKKINVSALRGTLGVTSTN